MKLFLIALSIAFRSAAELASKIAALQSNLQGESIFNYWVLLVVTFLVLQTAVWTLALRRLSLVFAYPFMSLSLPLTYFGSVILFEESFSAQRLLGIAIIVFGILLACWPVREHSAK